MPKIPLPRWQPSDGVNMDEKVEKHSVWSHNSLRFLVRTAGLPSGSQCRHFEKGTAPLSHKASQLSRDSSLQMLGTSGHRARPDQRPSRVCKCRVELTGRSYYDSRGLARAAAWFGAVIQCQWTVGAGHADWSPVHLHVNIAPAQDQAGQGRQGRTSDRPSPELGSLRSLSRNILPLLLTGMIAAGLAH